MHLGGPLPKNRQPLKDEPILMKKCLYLQCPVIFINELLIEFLFDYLIS